MSGNASTTLRTPAGDAFNRRRLGCLDPNALGGQRAAGNVYRSALDAATTDVYSESMSHGRFPRSYSPVSNITGDLRAR